MWCESVRRSERRCQQPPVDSIRKEKNETGILGCGSSVVAYFNPASYTDHLHFTLTIYTLHWPFTLYTDHLHFQEVAGGFENSHKTWFISRTTGALAQKE